MLRIGLILIMVVCIISAFVGCAYDKKELIYPTVTCDTTNVTYTDVIEPLVRQRCYSCHAGPGGGISGTSLDSYDDLKTVASFGEVVHRITTTDPSEMMPKGGPRLSDCEISKITTWVNNGYKK